MKITDVPSEHFWCSDMVGDEVKAVEVQLDDGKKIYLYDGDELELGWWKVTVGRGHSKFGHKPLPDTAKFIEAYKETEKLLSDED